MRALGPSTARGGGAAEGLLCMRSAPRGVAGGARLPSHVLHQSAGLGRLQPLEADCLRVATGQVTAEAEGSVWPRAASALGPPVPAGGPCALTLSVSLSLFSPRGPGTLCCRAFTRKNHLLQKQNTKKL